jgi:hypothetical protein
MLDENLQLRWWVASVCVCVGEARHMQLMSHRDRHCGALRAFARGFSLATRSASDDTPAARATACSLNWRSPADPDCSIYHRNKDQTAPKSGQPPCRTAARDVAVPQIHWPRTAGRGPERQLHNSDAMKPLRAVGSVP